MEKSRAGTESQVESTLRDWQGKISFEKTLGSAAVSRWCQLTLPARIWRQHGDKIQKYVILQSVPDGKMWTVEISVYFPHNLPQVTFYLGWKAFVVANGLVKGDRLTFTLTAISKFEVFILRRGEDPKLPSVQGPKLGLKDSAFSQRRPEKSLARQHTDLSGKSSVKKEREFNGRFADKGTAEDGIAHSAYNELTDSSESPSDMDSYFFEPMQQKSEQEALSKSFNYMDCHSQSQNALPRFCKRISCSNVLEIPCGFLKSHWSQIGSTHVKLQGIHEGSQVQDVKCTCVIDRGRPRLFFKSSCWNNFVIDNCLQIGQRLVFTLTAYSFFVVRSEY